MPELKQFELLDRYLNGTATVEETLLVEKWLDEVPEAQNRWKTFSEAEKQEFVKDLFHEIRHDIRQPKVQPFVRNFRLYQVAAVLVMLIAATWLFTMQGERSANPDNKVAGASEIILPGGEKATLTLSDGSVYVLDSANGMIATEGSVSVRNVDGELVYTANGVSGKQEVFNTIKTPNGGQYMLTLSDGSRVWLNAASTLKYPAAFTEGERVVEMTGECYFDIRHTGQPFTVKNGHVSVNVLGTEFNINGYEEQPNLSVTLLRGAVKVKVAGSQVLLKPGEQAVVSAGKTKLLSGVDTSAAVAWKNGYFNFQNDNVEAIMQQLSRWYNVEIVYPPNLPDGGFTGEISRSLALNEVLKILSETGIRYKLEGRKLIVLP